MHEQVYFNMSDFLRYSAHWLTESTPRIAVIGGLLVLIALMAVVRYIDRRQEQRAYDEMLREMRVRSIAEGYARQAARREGRA